MPGTEEWVEGDTPIPTPVLGARRAQAEAIVRRVAGSRAGRSVAEVRRLLTTALRGVGVRPTAATLGRLSTAISTGRGGSPGGLAS